MGDLINGRTPEKILFNIRVCAHGSCLSECPYDSSTNCKEDLLSDALAYIKHLKAERDAALKCVPHSCATCNHAMYRVLAEGAGCKTISVFCKEKECRDGEKWEPCEARMDEEDK